MLTEYLLFDYLPQDLVCSHLLSCSDRQLFQQDIAEGDLPLCLIGPRAAYVIVEVLYVSLLLHVPSMETLGISLQDCWIYLTTSSTVPFFNAFLGSTWIHVHLHTVCACTFEKLPVTLLIL